jgi:hypothetical protein
MLVVNELLAVKVTIAGSVNARSYQITSCECVRFMVFNDNFSYIVAVSFIGGGY